MTTLRPHPVFLPPPPQASLTPSSPKPSSINPKPLNYPNYPSLSTDSGLQFREKLVYISTQLNVNPQKALEKNPDFRSCPLSSIHSVQSCLSSMGIERAAMGRILDMHPQLLTVDPHLHLYPVFDFLLHDAAIPFPDIRKSILRCPRLLVCDVTSQLRPALHFLTRLGFKRVTSKTTVLLVSSVKSTLVPKVEYLRSLGLSKKEVETMVVRSPALLTLSIENNYKPKVGYLVEEMKRDVMELKRFPQYFSFSLEGKIKPRHRLLVEHGFSLPLREMLRMRLLDALVIYRDNEAAVFFNKNNKRSSNSKHIDLKYYSVRERVMHGEVTVLDINTDSQLADPFTKALPVKVFKNHAESIGILPRLDA